MGMMEWFGKQMIKRMSPQERFDLTEMAVMEIIASMTSDEKKDLMVRLIPRVSKTMLDGMTPEDRRKVVEGVAPALLAQMSSSGALTGIVELMRNKKKD
ncbi:MAG: hypothetical protein SA339_05385 [Methanomassiliicoccus sp.]|nr:hypothetical protein [Methanomassiliicoccus sp.]